MTTLVSRSRSLETETEFRGRVRKQADDLKDALDEGRLDNDDFTVGLEMEVYAVTAEDEQAATTTPETESHSESDFTLASVPTAVFESGATKELGLHNAEINTAPDNLDGTGLATQATRLEADFERAQQAARESGRELVLDAMWTVPPREGSDGYLTDVTQHDTESNAPDDHITVATNMRPDPRYVAIDNAVLDAAGGDVPLRVPGVKRTFPTILFESLATSIQPHLQIPSVDAFPAYYNYAIRTLGPILALSSNSPFLPPDLYDDVEDPHQLVEETHHELRIAVFEQSVNHTRDDKVSVPRDISQTSDTVESVVADDLYAPYLYEWVGDERESFLENHWEFTYKRSTYWRWLRCVVGGRPVEDACDERSVRIEYRPIPTQPTIRDVISLQTLTVGLVCGLVAADHPVAALPWEDAKTSFYNAARNGLFADLWWIDKDGETTTDSARIFEEVFEYARFGLQEFEVPAADIDRYFGPLETRWETTSTPSIWKKSQVRDRLDEGYSLDEAITAMQREYVRLSRETECFEDW